MAERETSEERLLRARRSLRGLSVGDALGEQLFGPARATLSAIQARRLPPGPWHYTDDTQMALSIVTTLGKCGRIDPDVLAGQFALRYEPWRGYGGGAHRLLAALRRGGSWQELAPAMFGGQGSFGNGAAMRVAPVGGYFADDIDACVKNAAASARVTHAHPEGIAGAIAVAVAAVLAWSHGIEGTPGRDAFLAQVADRVPPSVTRQGLERASRLPFATDPGRAAGELGSGYLISAQDTVPFAVWCAARHLDSFEDAFWTTASGLGDIDTTCAISCGIVALASSVPMDWVALREPLPEGFELER